MWNCGADCCGGPRRLCYRPHVARARAIGKWVPAATVPHGRAGVTEALMNAGPRELGPLLARLETDDDCIAVWRDVLAATNGAKILASPFF